MKKAFIICAGDMKDANFYRERIDGTIICADNGLANAAQIGVCPHVAIGDFDSYKGELPENIKIIRYPSVKDKTDTHLAVLYALKEGYSHITLCCALGGRFDHALANVNLLRVIKENGAQGVIMEPNNTIMLLSGQNELEGTGYVSVIPTDKSLVTLKNLKYELNGNEIKAGDTLGISNEFLQGSATLFMSEDCFVILS